MITRPMSCSLILSGALAVVAVTSSYNANAYQEKSPLKAQTHAATHTKIYVAGDQQSNARVSYVSNTEIQSNQLNQLQNTIGNEQDKAALRLLLSEFITLKATFKQSIVDMQGNELQNAKGELLLQKPQKLRWSVESPDESLLIANGSSVYNVDPFLEQVTILEQAPLTQSNPLMLLISNDQAQWDQVSVTQQSQQNLAKDVVNEQAPVDAQRASQEPSQKHSTYTLISLLPDSSINKLILRFDDQNKLASLVSYDRQQQRNMLDFTNVTLNEGVSDSNFMFTPNQNWVVDDQRKSPANQ